MSNFYELFIFSHLYFLQNFYMVSARFYLWLFQGVDPKEFNRPLSRRDVFLQGSIRNLKEFEDDGTENVE